MHPDFQYAVNVLLGGGLLTACVLLYRARAEKRKTDAETGRTDSEATKTDADASKVIADTALELLKPLRERIEELENRVHSAVTTLEDYEHHYGPLTDAQRAWRSAT